MAITPLNEKDRAWVVEEAKRRAGAGATDAEQKRELYNYAVWQGKTPEDLDQWMGYDAGTSAAWNAQNPLGAGVAPAASMNADTSNLGLNPYNTPLPVAPAATPAATPAGGSPSVGNVSAGDNRWSGDPTRQPDGSFNPQPTGGNLGMGDSGYQRNPYLDAMSRDMGGQMFDQWNRNVAPGLRSGAMATGGYGGSRQGVVEANSLNDLGRNYGQALTSMYGQDYTNYQNRGIQRQGQAQSYDLGLRSNDLGFANLDSNIYQNNFNNQLQSANFGLGVQNFLNNNNQTGIKAGTDIQNTQWDYQKYLNAAGNAAGNAGGNRTNTTTGG